MGDISERHTKTARRPTFSDLLADERGAEQLEYLVILAGVVLPLAFAAEIMASVLLYYFQLESFVIDLPLF